jgi:hypothetical protein
MANGDVTLHNHFMEEHDKGNVDLVNDAFKVMLLNGWTPDPTTDENIDDISANEISLTGYTAGGQALAGLSVVRDDTNHETKWTFTSPYWASIAAGTVTRAAVFKDTGVESTSIIVGNIEIETNPNGQSFTLTIGANGFMIKSRTP